MPRHRFKVAAWLTLVALPFLVVDNVPRTDANASAKVVAVAAPPSTAPSATYPAPTEPPPTTAPPVTAAAPTPTTVAAVTNTAKKAATPTTVVTATTTTTAPPPPPTTAPPPSNAQEGSASWYAYRAGECAHVTLPMGTVVYVTSLSTGTGTSCTVTDRGPFGAGRIIDLDRATFAQLADPSVGIIQVRITW